MGTAAARAVLIGLFVAAAISGCGTKPRFPRYDIVLISIDALRSDFVGCYGSPLGCTPEIDSLARRGIVVERAFTAAPWTRPSIASLWTGLFPGRHGVVGRHLEDRLPPRAVTLAEAFQKSGYATFGFATNQNLSPLLGFSAGFDRYVSRIVPAETVRDSAMTWVERTAMDERRPPIFLALHFDEPHGAFFRTSFTYAANGRSRAAMIRAVEPLNGGERVAAVARYLARIRRVDQEVGELVRALEARLGPRLLVIITADHGEEWFDHGGVFHGFTLHREVLQVPFILYSPGFGHARRDGPVSLVDVFPTLAAWTGFVPPEELDGADLGDALLGRGGFPRRVFAETSYEKNLESVEEGCFKLIRDRDTGEELLYDTRTDPEETTDLTRRYPSIAKNLGRRLDKARDRWERGRTRFSIPNPSDALEQEKETKLKEDLAALGYVVDSTEAKEAWPEGTRTTWRDLFRLYRYLPPEDEAFRYYPAVWRPASLPARRIGGPNDVVAATLDGEEAYVVLGKHDWSGIAEIRVDGTHLLDVDLYDPAGEDPQEVIPIRFPAPGAHTVEVRATGRRNPSAHAAEVLFDGMVVDRSTAPSSDGITRR